MIDHRLSFNKNSIFCFFFLTRKNNFLPFLDNYKNFPFFPSCLPPTYEFFIITFPRNVSSPVEKIFIFTSYCRRRLLLQDRMLQVPRAIHRSRLQDVRPAPPLGLTILVQNHCFRQILKTLKELKESFQLLFHC